MKTHNATRELWKVRIPDYLASGLTMSAWCAANDCTKDQLRYWLKKSKNNISSPLEEAANGFVPLTVMEPESVPVHTTPLQLYIGPTRIELRAGFDPQLLRQVVQALC
jgi:hypothetical protein